MIDRVVNWLGVIICPLLAGSFVYNIYHDIRADWIVWFYAYLGLFHTFIICAADLQRAA